MHGQVCINKEWGESASLGGGKLQTPIAGGLVFATTLTQECNIASNFEFANRLVGLLYLRSLVAAVQSCLCVCLARGVLGGGEVPLTAIEQAFKQFVAFSIRDW